MLPGSVMAHLKKLRRRLHTDLPDADDFNEARGQVPQPKQLRCICTGGHLTEPYEQYTQQSPGLGRSTVLQPSHS